MSFEKKINSFLQTIYTLNPFDEYRSLVLRSLQDILVYDSAAFFLLGPNEEDFTAPVHLNLDEHCFRDYSLYYHQFDFYKDQVLSLRPIPVTDRSSDYLYYPEWAKNEHRSDFLIQNGMYHIACVQLFDNKNRLVGELSLHRNQHQSDFSDQEMKQLQLLAPHIQTSLANQLQQRETVRFNSLLLQAMAYEMHSMILLDHSLNPIHLNQGAEDWLNQWNSTTRQFFWQELKKNCRHLNNAQQKIDLSTCAPHQFPFSFKGHILQIRICYITEGSLNLRYFVCSLTPSLKFSSSEHHTYFTENLTPKEHQVYLLLLQGKTNPEISQILQLSIHTVKTHLKNILQKCNVRSRVELLSKENYP